MRLGKPDYYDEFRCIAGACSDSCCIGWEIDVDEEKREFYRQIPGELGKRLETCIDREAGSFILQGEEERCPFLNEENLCDLIISLGEDALCDICREHPRFYDWFDGYTEVGLGLCCEAAGRLILGNKEPVRLVIAEVPGEETEPLEENLPEEDPLERILFDARDQIFFLLQNRSKTIWERMREVLMFSEELQEWLDGEAEWEENTDISLSAERIRELPVLEEIHPNQRTDAYAGLLSLLGELEPIDGSWPKTLEALKDLIRRSEEFAEKECDMLEIMCRREHEYEQLAVYFVYRYFMKAREDEDVRSKGKLMVISVLLIHILNVACFAAEGVLTTEDCVRHAKCCSKEIEYSEENLELLADACWESEQVSLENLYLLLYPGYCKK